MDLIQKKHLESILLKSEQIQLLESQIIQIVPELIVCKDCNQNLPAHCMPVLAHIFEVVNGVDKELTLKLAALFHDIGKPYVKKTVNGVDSFQGHEKVSELLAGLILQRLGFDNDIKQNVCLLIKYHDFELSPTQESMDYITQKIGSHLVLPLLELQWSDLLAHSEKKINEYITVRKATKTYYKNNYITN